MAIIEIGGHHVLEVGEDAPVVGKVEDALDLIGSATAGDAVIVVLPASRLAPEFFSLRTGLAGEIMQKFQNYRMRLMVFGDISDYVAASTSLRDFVHETNRVGNHRFLPNREALEAALAPPQS